MDLFIYSYVCNFTFVSVYLTSRRNPMGLLIAPDDNGNADGELFWDDGDSRGIISFLIFCLFVCKCVVSGALQVWLFVFFSKKVN